MSDKPITLKETAEKLATLPHDTEFARLARAYLASEALAEAARSAVAYVDDGEGIEYLDTGLLERQKAMIATLESALEAYEQAKRERSKYGI